MAIEKKLVSDENGKVGDNAENQNGNNDDDNNNDNNDGKKKDEKNTVDYATFSKLLDQKKARDKELADLKAERDNDNKKKLLEKEQYKKLYEETNEKLNEATGKLGELTQNRIEDFKEAAFLKTLPSQLLNSEYMAHADIKDIILDEETGTINMDSVKGVVDKFVKIHGHLLVKKNKQNLPNNAPGNTNSSQGKITYAEWQKLPLADKKKRINDVEN